MHKRCVRVSVWDVVNQFLLKNVAKSLKGHVSASLMKDKKMQRTIKKSVLGYLCHSHCAHVLSPSFLLIIPSWAPAIHLVPGGIGHFSPRLNAGSINRDSFNIVCLASRFLETVFLLEEGVLLTQHLPFPAFFFHVCLGVFYHQHLYLISVFGGLVNNLEQLGQQNQLPGVVWAT